MVRVRLTLLPTELECNRIVDGSHNFLDYSKFRFGISEGTITRLGARCWCS